MNSIARFGGSILWSLFAVTLVYAQTPVDVPNEILITLRMPPLRAPKMTRDEEKVLHALLQKATATGKYRTSTS